MQLMTEHKLEPRNHHYLDAQNPHLLHPQQPAAGPTSTTSGYSPADQLAELGQPADPQPANSHFLHEPTGGLDQSGQQQAGQLQRRTNIMSIQPTGFTKNHLLAQPQPPLHLVQSGAIDELAIKRRREDLSRRPSYRKIFNDLAGLSGAPMDQPSGNPLGLARQSPQTLGQPLQAGSPSPQALDLLHQVGALQQGQSTGSPVQVVDLQTGAGQHQLPPTNHLQSGLPQQQQAAGQPHLLNPQQAPHQHHLPHHQQPQQQQQQPPPPQQHHQSQHHQHPHLSQHQHVLQMAHAPPATTPTGQLHPQLLTGGQSSPSVGTPQSQTGLPVSEEATKKRELRLQKNREAAKECRRKKKEYIKCLENRVAVLENQNKALIDELKTLKDLYCKSNTE